MREDTSTWKDIDWTNDDAEGMAWTRLRRVLDGDAVCRILDRRALDEVTTLLVTSLVGSGLNYSQAVSAGSEVLSRSPMAVFGGAFNSHLCSLLQRAWWPSLFRDTPD